MSRIWDAMGRRPSEFISMFHDEKCVNICYAHMKIWRICTYIRYVSLSLGARAFSVVLVSARSCKKYINEIYYVFMCTCLRLHCCFGFPLSADVRLLFFHTCIQCCLHCTLWTRFEWRKDATTVDRDRLYATGHVCSRHLGNQFL